MVGLTVLVRANHPQLPELVRVECVVECDETALLDAAVAQALNYSLQQVEKMRPCGDITCGPFGVMRVT